MNKKWCIHMISMNLRDIKMETKYKILISSIVSLYVYTYNGKRPLDQYYNPSEGICEQ